MDSYCQYGNDKAVLHCIKAAFAFSWAFANAICYFLTSRFFTMMTGNTLILAVATLQWKTEEMMFTATLIILFICGGAAYGAISFWFKNEARVVKLFIAPSCLLLGVASDVTQFIMGSCSSGTLDKCSGRHLYFLTPMSILTGIVTSYFAHHPDGIITTLLTGHMKVPPKMALKRVMQGSHGVWEKAGVSAMVIISFFLGSLLGALASEAILLRYSNGLFTPILTCFAFVISTLTLMHFTLCERFCHNYRLENELIEMIGDTMRARGADYRNTNMNDLQRMMTMAIADELEYGDDEAENDMDAFNDNEVGVR